MADRYWVGCTEANALAASPVFAPHVVAPEETMDDLERALIEKHTQLLYAAFRKFRAATGHCPDCGHPVTLDLACEVSDPPHGKENRRVAPAALCSYCELCIEL